MKKLIAVLLAVFSLQANAADSWSKSDVAREVAYLTLHVVDWRQTLIASKDPGRYAEQNPILGEHPSENRINGYFLATALLHVGVTHVLPAKWRPAFQYFWIGVEVVAIANNHKVGIRITF